MPEPARLEAPSLGPHLSYAVQWFLFASVALIGWIFFVRRAAREHAP